MPNPDSQAGGAARGTPAASSNQGSGGYSLQGEEDLFRDPFSEFRPSSR
jgi:hypothetical protein